MAEAAPRVEPSGVCWLPGAPRLIAAARPELPQKDDLCGPFWALAAARALTGPDAPGLDAPGPDLSGVEDGQELAALAAGTLLWTGGVSVPPGQPHRRDYRRDLPTTADAEFAGTDRPGVVRALRALTADAVTVVELVDPAGERRLFDELAQEGSDLAVIANVATEQYLFPTVAGAAERYLSSGDLSGYRPSGWSAGHFVAVLGHRDGPGGRLYCIHDTYPVASPTDGGGYVHDQPEEALIRALGRPGRTPGSLIIVRRRAD